VNGEDLTVDDLVELKTARTVRPRNPTLTSIPSLLSAFQDEWDAIALEAFTLKQHLVQTRQELSTALYEYDAALKVISKLGRERDEARDALSKVTVNAGASAGNGDAMQVDGQGLPDEIAAKVDATQQQLSSTRRRRQVPADWATAEDIEAFDSLDSTEAVYPGARAVAVDETGDLAIYGGKAGFSGVYSVSQEQTVQVLKCGSGVTDALWWGTRPVVATSAGAVKVFENGQEVAQLGSHAGPATALALHPSGEILASVGVDKSWKLHDLTAMKTVTQIFTSSGKACIEC